MRSHSSAQSQAASGNHKTAADLQHLIRLQYPARQLPLTEHVTVQTRMLGNHSSRQRGRGMNFEELRHYRIGDDIRQMDWKVSNRTRKPHVRVYAEEREQPVLLVVDMRQAMYFGSRRMMKSVVAAEVAALLAWHVVHKGDRIGLLIFNEQQCHEVRPRRSQHQIMRILNLLCDYSEQLSELRSSPANQLNPMLHRIHNLTGHDGSIHLISDLDHANDETTERLSQLARHNNVCVNYIYDPLEHHLPQQGRLAVSDGQFQVELNMQDAQLRLRFAEGFDQRLQQIQQFLRARSIPVRPLSTATSVEEQLRRMLRPAMSSTGSR